MSNSAYRRPLSRLERVDGGPRRKRMHQRHAFAIQRSQWAMLLWLEEQERLTAVKVAEDADFTVE